MANLTSKTKFVNIVVRKKDFKISDRDKYIRRWCEENCEYYAYIYHKEDLNLEHIKEDEHLHLVGILKKSILLSTTLNSFCEFLDIKTLGVEIDKCNSVEGSIQYLIHKNDPQKTQHKKDEIVSNYDRKDLDSILETDCYNITPQRLRDMVKKASSNYELIEKLGIERYIRWRRVISDIREDLRIWNY